MVGLEEIFSKFGVYDYNILELTISIWGCFRLEPVSHLGYLAPLWSESQRRGRSRGRNEDGAGPFSGREFH